MPYIIGTIDGSHVLILVIVVGKKNYYYVTSFHSIIVHGIVRLNYMFQDYEFGLGIGFAHLDCFSSYKN